MRALSIVSAALVAAISAFIYSRASLLYIFYANAPERLQRVNNVKNLQVKFADKIRYCEDVAIDAFEGFAILSCDPGRGNWNTVMGPLTDPIATPETGLYIWDYDTRTTVPEKLKFERFEHREKTFHPLGIDYIHDGRKLFVVNLCPENPGIEIFKLSAIDRKLSHVRTMSHELLSTPNAVAAFNNTQFFATNDHHFQLGSNPNLSMLETYLALPGGNIVHGDRPAKFRKDKDLDVKVMDRLGFANGIAFLNATTLAAASTSRSQVYLYNVIPSASNTTGSTHPTLSLIKTLSIPFLVDNLKSDKKGTLFLAGHPHPASTEHMARNAAACASASKEGCDEEAKGSSWIAEWNERDGWRDLYVGDEYPTSSAYVKDKENRVGIAVGLYGKGVLTWEVPKE